jgi:hypothetical protein
MRLAAAGAFQRVARLKTDANSGFTAKLDDLLYTGAAGPFCD